MAFSVEHRAHPLHAQPGEAQTPFWARRNFTNYQKVFGCALMVAAAVASIFAAPVAAVVAGTILGSVIIGSAILQQLKNPTLGNKPLRVFTAICYLIPTPLTSAMGSLAHLGLWILDVNNDINHRRYVVVGLA